MDLGGKAGVVLDTNTCTDIGEPDISSMLGMKHFRIQSGKFHIYQYSQRPLANPTIPPPPKPHSNLP